MKYIIVEDCGCKSAILFSEIMTHNSFEVCGKIISAGFCNIGNNDVSVWGSSVSLGLRSRPEDIEIIEKSITFTC